MRGGGADAQSPRIYGRGELAMCPWHIAGNHIFDVVLVILWYKSLISVHAGSEIRTRDLVISSQEIYLCATPHR